MDVTLSLSGAGTQGAFLSGAINSLHYDHGCTFAQIDGCSAGAMTGAVLAAGVAYGCVGFAIDMITEEWIERGNWWNALQPTACGVLSLTGLSTTERLYRTVRRMLFTIHQAYLYPIHDVRLTIAVTSLESRGVPLPTHRRHMTFMSWDFETIEGLEEIADWAAASAAVPGVFVPRLIEGRHYVDGGVTMIEQYPTRLHGERAIAVCAYDRSESVSGLGMLARIPNIALWERVFDALALSPSTVVIPNGPLPGNFVTCGLSRSLRDRCWHMGRDAARAANLDR